MYVAHNHFSAAPFLVLQLNYSVDLQAIYLQQSTWVDNMYLKVLKFVVVVLLFISPMSASNAATTGQIFGYCQSYKSNGFKASTAEHIACQWYFGGVKDSLTKICITKKVFVHMGNNEFINESLIDMVDHDIEPLIISFLNWANNNPKNWNDYPVAHIADWGAKDFPCN